MNFICYYELFIHMYSFQSSSGVAEQAIEVILILLRPVFQEREKGAYFLFQRLYLHVLLSWFNLLLHNSILSDEGLPLKH